MNYHTKINISEDKYLLDIREFGLVRCYNALKKDTNTMDVRYRELHWLASLINKVGFNLEFGVYSGRTINCLSSLRPDLSFVGFDSFEGLPSDWDMGGKLVQKEYFKKQEMPIVNQNVTLVKGFFDKTINEWKSSLNKERLKKNKKFISYLHIDGDLYSSAIDVLFGLDEFIKPGTIIRFDELCCWRTIFQDPVSQVARAYYTTWREHEWKALNEWMLLQNRKVLPICRNWFQSGTVIVTQ